MAVATRTGLSHVIWAIGEFFLYFFIFLYILNQSFIVYTGYKLQNMQRGQQQQQEQAQTMCLTLFEP